MVDALETDGNLSNRSIAKRMGVRHETITRWTRRYPEFRAWVGQQLERASTEQNAHVIRRCLSLALRGSIDHAKLYLQATGRLGRVDGPGVSVNVSSGRTQITNAAEALTIRIVDDHASESAGLPGGG